MMGQYCQWSRLDVALSLHSRPPACTRTHSRARAISYGLSPTPDAACMYVCMKITCIWPPHIMIMTRIVLTPQPPFGCVYKLDNELGVDGANALLPALKQMKHMTTLDLFGKFRMTHAYGMLSTGGI